MQHTSSNSFVQNPDASALAYNDHDSFQGENYGQTSRPTPDSSMTSKSSPNDGERRLFSQFANPNIKECPVISHQLFLEMRHQNKPQ
jgi:hypothetical protein